MWFQLWGGFHRAALLRRASKDCRWNDVPWDYSHHKLWRCVSFLCCLLSCVVIVHALLQMGLYERDLSLRWTTELLGVSPTSLAILAKPDRLCVACAEACQTKWLSRSVVYIATGSSPTVFACPTRSAMLSLTTTQRLLRDELWCWIVTLCDVISSASLVNHLYSCCKRVVIPLCLLTITSIFTTFSFCL